MDYKSLDEMVDSVLSGRVKIVCTNQKPLADFFTEMVEVEGLDTEVIFENDGIEYSNKYNPLLN